MLSSQQNIRGCSMFQIFVVMRGLEKYGAEDQFWVDPDSVVFPEKEDRGYVCAKERARNSVGNVKLSRTGSGQRGEIIVVLEAKVLGEPDAYKPEEFWDL